MVSQRKRIRKIKTIIGKGIDDSGIALSVQGWNNCRNRYFEIHEEVLRDIIDIKMLKENADRLAFKMNSDKYGDDIEKMQMYHRWEWIKRDIQGLTI